MNVVSRGVRLPPAALSNDVGGPYVGNARWIGVPLDDLLKEAGVKPPSRGGPADQLVARSVDGTVMIAGAASAQHRGVDRVEVRVDDDGPWMRADLAAEDTTDTWRQWSLPRKATSGGHTLTVRATDRTGQVQPEQRARTIADGAGGWHSAVVTVD